MARVLQVVTELVVGGASLSMLDFAEDLAAEHELVIAHGLLADPGNAACRRARARFATYELPSLERSLDPLADLKAARALAVVCRRLRPDVIHTHSSKAGFIGRMAAPPAVRICLHTIHGWGHTPIDQPPRRRLLIAAERLAARRTSRLIAVSAEVRDEGLALRIGRPDQYSVIGEPVDMRPRCADFELARAAARATLQLPGDADVIGWVGRFGAQKDPRTLAQVLAKLVSERHNTYAVLIGDGPQRAEVEDLLAAQIRARRIALTGERDDVRAMYSAFDVVVHPSRWEGHPRVVREALAERVPVVSAHVSGTSELGTDARLGALVPVGDAGAFAQALELILDAPERRAPIDECALAPLRASAQEPYRLMRELYAASLASADHEPA